MKVLILGHKGMLGNAVYKYLNSKTDVITQHLSDFRWYSKSFVRDILTFDGDYIINCIGAIPQRTDKFEVNYELPIWLDKNVKCKIIHPATDCEMDNDDYGKSKSKAGIYLESNGNNTKQIMTSIIGHELNSSNSLLDWFLNANGEVSGYSECYWNGNTTLEWAKQSYDMIINWDSYSKKTTIISECISKYELLNIIKGVYNKNIIVNQNNNIKANKCLLGIERDSIEIQLKELKEFYDN